MENNNMYLYVDEIGLETISSFRPKITDTLHNMLCVKIKDRN